MSDTSPIGLEALVTATNQVASFPAIIHRITREVDNPQSSLRRVAELVAEDPALAARLLKLANSGFFSFPFPVATITRALTLIGTKQFRDLVTSTMVTNIFRGQQEMRVNMHAFWCHSISCGVAARVIATARREANAERYYLMGLLHDIGRLVLFSQLPDITHNLLQRHTHECRPLYQLEQELLGFDHALLGSELLRNWNLPPDLSLPIRWHHLPSQATDYRMETAILHVADLLALTLSHGNSGETRLPPLDPAAWELIDLPASVVGGIVVHFEHQLNDALDIFLS